MDFRWPESRDAIDRSVRERKRLAFERAKRAPFYRGRLDGIDAERLDDPEVWAKIPLLTKDELRTVPAREFYDTFCIAPRSDVVEYWRSGGATGRPLFYPRSAVDMDYALLAFRRSWPAIGATTDDMVHVSFPLGIHPVAHLYARTAEDCGIGTIWCGAGTNTPSEMQLSLIDELKPTIWAGMASYGLHLANLAEAKGIDLAASSVKKIVCAAEPMSPAKRQKLERMWGAEVFDQFGMTEASLMSVESRDHVGQHVWTDLWHVEVVDETTGKPVREGEIGAFVMTPLWSNTVTPFLRWISGDLVSITQDGAGSGPWSMFPIMRHARRTVGFFKVRGININHPELEDLMFYEPDITDFRAEVFNSDAGNDVLHLLVESKRGVNDGMLKDKVEVLVKKTFEVTPQITVLAAGTIAREFESNVKLPRFIDKRG